MKNKLSALLLAVISGSSIAAAPASTAVSKGPTFLACTGTQPWWEQSWATSAKGVGNDQGKVTIKLSADKTTATVMLVNLGEQVFSIKTSDEFYSGSKDVGLPTLDGVISKAYISINRINGTTHVGFQVTSSPPDGGRTAFSGSCEPAATRF